MGTRGMIGVVAEGRLYGAYNHCDSYPEGLGEKVAAAIEEIRKDIAAWKTRALALRVVEPSDSPTADELARLKQTHDPDVSSVMDWYAALRGCQGILTDYLEMGVITDDAVFVKDSLFCEYAYVADLDRAVLILLRGMNKDRSKEAPYPWCRHTDEEVEKDKARWRGFGPYYGCSLAAELPFAEVSFESICAAYRKVEGDEAKALAG